MSAGLLDAAGPAASCPAWFSATVCSKSSRPNFGDGLFQIFQAELQLVGRQLFGAAAKLLARQPLD
jgi:hypothetical protein